MSRSAFDAHTDPLFKNLKILNLESIYKLQIGKFMYQYKSGLLPYSFNNMFLVTRQVHSYCTRSSELSKILNFLTLLVLKFEMQQVPLPFAVS